MVISCSRDNEEIYSNPVYTGNTIAATVQPKHEEEHVYDTVNYNDVDVKERKPKNKVSSNINVYQNFSVSVNENKDCSTIKSDQVLSSDHESKMYHSSTETTKKTRWDKPKLPTNPKCANVPKVAPRHVDKSHHQTPTTEDPSLEDEYILPDPKYALHTNDEYASQQTENSQYTSLAVPQSAAYQELDSRSSPPSKYLVPRRLPTTN